MNTPVAAENFTASEQDLLRLVKISKVYPTIVANEEIDLVVKAGEIRAILGENGAGKSTLMKMIYGVTAPSTGEIYWQGKKINIANPAQARILGIGMVFQHFSLFETLSITDNIALALPANHGITNLEDKISEVSQKYGLPVEPRRYVHSLSVGERQRVEIIRCLLLSPRLLIMDEPTSVLTPQAVRVLFATLRQLSAEGCAILYISHKLDEIQELCHTATVLRNGKVTGHCIPSEETPKSMAELMIGKDLPSISARDDSSTSNDVCLRLAGLSHTLEDPFAVELQNISLEVHRGEIVGIAGISGNGQQELLAAISGEHILAEKHPVQINSQEVGRLAPDQRRQLGLCFVPEERLGRGAVPSMSLIDNAILTAGESKHLVSKGWVKRKLAQAFAAQCISDFSVKCSGPAAPANSLSGGNLQKFIVAREILQNPKVLVVAQPTWGVDVGAAALIHQAIIDLRNQGCAVLVISEELDELFVLCDKLAVLAKGRLSPIVETSQISKEEIGVWMSGMWDSAPSH